MISQRHDTLCGSVGVYLSALFSFIFSFNRILHVWKCIYGLNILLIKFHSFLHYNDNVERYNAQLIFSYVLYIAHIKWYMYVLFRIYCFASQREYFFHSYSTDSFIKILLFCELFRIIFFEGVLCSWDDIW